MPSIYQAKSLRFFQHVTSKPPRDSLYAIHLPRSIQIWPWVKIQIVPPVHIPIPTKIGSKMGAFPKMGSQNGFDHHSHLSRSSPSALRLYLAERGSLEAQALEARALGTWDRGKEVWWSWWKKPRAICRVCLVISSSRETYLVAPKRRPMSKTWWTPNLGVWLPPLDTVGFV